MVEAVGTAPGDMFHVSYLYDGLGRRTHSRDHVTNTVTFHLHVDQMEVEDYAATYTCPPNYTGAPGEGCTMDTLTPTARGVLS